MKLDNHPTVMRIKKQRAIQAVKPKDILDSAQLRQLVLDAGADDVGFVEVDRPELKEQKRDILSALPKTKTLISYVIRLNQEPIRTPARSMANMEFHHVGDEINELGRSIVGKLQEKGIRALNPAMGFPMEMDKFPGKVWVVSHKPIAVAAGLGKMGIHRLVIHPKFGNFILLGTILVDAKVSHYDRPIDYNPCVECKLCVQACPVGAIQPDGAFNFSACYTHNYKEFMGGFTNWTEQIADSKNHLDLRKKVNDSESASMWQSLSFGANYKAAYCMAACPAGEDVMGPFLDNRQDFAADHLKPLQEKEEVVYVLKNSDAEEHVAKRFPNKRTQQVKNSLRSRSIDGLRMGLSLLFQPGQSKGLDATYHFTFTGKEARQMTVIIKNQKLRVKNGIIGTASLKITADTETWLGFLAKEKGLVWALLTRKIRLKGSPRLLIAFGKCFAA